MRFCLSDEGYLSTLHVNWAAARLVHDCSGIIIYNKVNLRTRCNMGPTILSLIERSSLSWRSQLGQKQVFFLERSLSQRFPYREFHCMILSCGIGRLYWWLGAVGIDGRHSNSAGRETAGKCGSGERADSSTRHSQSL